MDKKKLYDICIDDRNINNLVEVIRENIRLSEKSIPKCVTMMKDIMKTNIYKLSRCPKSKDEIKEFIRILNKMCVGTVIETIAKKYPDLHISRRVQIGEEQLKRDRDVMGERPNHIQDRPYAKSRREYDDDKSYTMKPNDIGFGGVDSNSGYASAFDNCLITNIGINQGQHPHNQQQNQSIPFNNGDTENNVNFEQRFQSFVNERNLGMNNNQKPETPDFTLDGSGQKVKEQKRLKQMEQMGMMNMGMNGMSSGMPTGMGGIDMSGMGMVMGNGPMSLDDPYMSILGAGAPQTQLQSMGGMNGLNGMSNMNAMNTMGSSIPFMGMGNPVMPVSSTNMMADQYGYNSNNFQGNYGNQSQPCTVKSMQLSNDFEKMLAQRRAIDLETGQPQTSSNLTPNSGSNYGYPMPNTMPNTMFNMQSNMMPTAQLPMMQPGLMPSMISNPMFNMTY